MWEITENVNRKLSKNKMKEGYNKDETAYDHCTVNYDHDFHDCLWWKEYRYSRRGNRSSY